MVTVSEYVQFALAGVEAVQAPLIKIPVLVCPQTFAAEVHVTVENVIGSHAEGDVDQLP